VEVSESRRRGFLAGAVAGTAAMAVMYLANLLTGLSPLPQLLQQPLLAVMPGPVFGFPDRQSEARRQGGRRIRAAADR